MGRPDAARPARNLAVDFYRASGVLLIVFGHWLLAGVTYHDGSFGLQNPLVTIPWTQWLTWPFQAVPVFFLVAGYAGAVSWEHRRAGGEPRQSWLRHRLARPLGPTAVYVALVSVVVLVLGLIGVPGSMLEFAGWAVAMHLWFLSVYLLVVALTPLAVAAHRRWGLWVLTVLGVAMAAVDIVAIAADVPHLGQTKYLLCWGLLYQLGIAWHDGYLGNRWPLVLAAASAAALALLIRFGPYPVSMISVPGETVHNSAPPSLAILAFGLTQAGIVISLAPALNRVLGTPRIERVLTVANENVMALYLWHMVPVIVVALVAYPAGLLPQPALGSGSWWLVRLLWVTVLAVVAALELAVLWWGRRLFAAPLPSFGVRLPDRFGEAMLYVGAGFAAYGLAMLAAQGFAPDGRFPWLTVAAFVIGVALVAPRPVAGPAARVR